MPSERERTLCFIVGAPRSGTTWIQRLLQAHPAICGGDESHFFTLFASPMTSADKMIEREKKVGPLAYIDREEFEDGLRMMWDKIFAGVYSSHPDASVHLEKSPFHAIFLDQIVRLFPDCRILFLTRDSRAVASSLVHAGRTWGDHWVPDTYRGAAIEWYRRVRAIKEWRECNPDHPFLRVRYEDALADTETELARMLRFLLPKTADLRVSETIETFEASGVMKRDPQGFSRLRGAEGWRQDMPLHGKLITWRYTRKLMRELGYDISLLR